VGVFAIVLEGVPDIVAEIVTQEVPVPTIGIGAGPACDGQVLVYHDVLGLHHDHLGKYVRQYAQLADIATEALEHFFADIESGSYPSDKESYHMDVASARAFHALMRKEE
jgi:3-methyl-2-oxobutanoate hydroxymethyltransferase